MRKAIQITLDTGPQTVNADVFGQWAAHDAVQAARREARAHQGRSAMKWLVILETPKGARVKRFKAKDAALFYADAHRNGRYQITIAYDHTADAQAEAA